jgi:hypothetical protein
MLFGEITVWNIICRMKNFCNVKAGGTYNTHCDLKAKYGFKIIIALELMVL